MEVIYIIGYIITFVVLLFCRKQVVPSPMMAYLDSMGIISPFNCTNGHDTSVILALDAHYDGVDTAIFTFNYRLCVVV